MKLSAFVALLLPVCFAVPVHAAVAAAAPGVIAPPPAGTPSAPGTGVAPQAGVVAPAYVIGPGDTLQVFVWRNPELSTTVPVRPDGKISTPLVEDMIAIGKTPSQLALDVERVLGEYVKSPQVSVIVTQAVSVYSQIKVTGQVLHPQALPFREGMTVLDAILAVGGMAQFASGNRAKVVRAENGRQVEIRVRLMKQNLALKAGDVLVVPESAF
jgi:polysaccharide export outer membrane protein